MSLLILPGRDMKRSDAEEDREDCVRIADCLAAIQAGFACISPGTVTFRRDDLSHLTVLAKQVKTVYLANDNEQSGAGRKGAWATAEFLEAHRINVKLVELPRPEGVEKVDLADFLKHHNADDLRNLMGEARDLFELCLDELGKDPQWILVRMWRHAARWPG